MRKFLKVAILGALFAGAGAIDAQSAGSVTIPLPMTAAEAAALVPASVRSMEFLTGTAIGVVLGEFGRVAWRWAQSFWATSMTVGTYALQYGGIAAVLVGLILLV